MSNYTASGAWVPPNKRPWRRLTAFITTQVLTLAVGVVPPVRWWNVGDPDFLTSAQVANARVQDPIQISPRSLPVPLASATTLPPLDGNRFIPGDVLATASISRGGRLERAEADKYLPYPYIEGLADALADPVVDKAIRASGIRTIVVVRGYPGDDNGHFGAAAERGDEPFLELRIAGEGADSPTFQRAIAIRIALVHEALHALNDIWYGDSTAPSMDGGPGLRQKIRDVQSTCGALFEAPTIRYVQAHRLQLAADFERAARGLAKDLQQGKQLNDANSYKAYAVLKATAKALRTNDRELARSAPIFDCDAPGDPMSPGQPIEDFVNAHSDIGPKSGVATDLDSAVSKWTVHITSADVSLADAEASPLRCYEDQLALRALTSSPSAVAGEARNSASEAASSFGVVAIFAPNAARRCTLSLRPVTRTLVGAYVSAIYRLEAAARPGLAQAISRDAGSVSNDLSASR